MKPQVADWLLPAACFVLEAALSVIYFAHAGAGFGSRSAVMLVGKVTIAAGVCAIAAGVWRFAHAERWLLMLNGLALAALGLILNGLTGTRISFRTVAVLIAVTAVSMGALGFAIARTLRRRGPGALLPRLVGIVSAVFAAAFLALGFRWIEVAPNSHSDLLWLGSYFAFSAACMLALALRDSTHGVPEPIQPEPSGL